MRPPRIPPMVTDIVQTALTAFDGMEFTTRDSCPFCGGTTLGYDTRTRKYAVIREGEQERTITVRVKRFTCRSCRKISNADEPFYPKTRIGSLVIDLFTTFASVMPPSKAARIISAMGIVVNRTSWKNYQDRKMPDRQTNDIFGLKLPASVLTLSTISAGLHEEGRISSSEALAACGFPSNFLPANPSPDPKRRIREDMGIQGERQMTKPIETPQERFH